MWLQNISKRLNRIFFVSSSELVIHYRRDAGVQCYAFALFYFRCFRKEPPQELLESRLDWFWSSERDHKTHPDSPVQGLPKTRSLTLLTPETAPLLLDELREYDIAGETRYLRLIGTDLGSKLNENPIEGFSTAMARFAQKEEPPIQMVITHIQDLPIEYVFVSRQPSQEINRLLRNWRITAEKVDETRKYRGLDMLLSPELVSESIEARSKILN